MAFLKSHRLSCVGVLFASLLLSTAPAAAQYFGRNKVQYDDFEFQQFTTEHFVFYFYPEEEQAVRDAARMAERWYQRHSRTFLREFKERKPVIFYANDADFQQTNAIGGAIGQGTGGVTESIKERVIMPLTGVYGDTDHVLGHELVHSFQYDIGLSRTDSIPFALNLLPLWLVEGMAEYLSIGRDDPHTAMWMRDAALRDDLPTIKELNQGTRYFPYRYGQAYLAYVGGKYGDAAVANLFKLGGRVGIDSAFVFGLGIHPDSLSNEWIQTIKDSYLPLTEGRTPPDSAGRRVLAGDLDAGDLNLAPAVSPDGKYVAFLSERDLFNINLFIADAETGQIVKRLKGTDSNPHFDAIRFINSSGSWSPDGRKFAFVTFVQGDNEIAILDWNSGDIEQRISVEGVTAMTNPAWSPDGQRLAFSGMNGGISDLYVLDMESGAVHQLTNDRYADLQPAWSPDGETLAFVTDRGPGGSDFETLSFGDMRIGLMSVDSTAADIRLIHPFQHAKHINPQFSPDGQNLYFISDQDGFQDLYRYALGTDETYRITRVQTGVSGITSLSPAMSVAAQSGRMMFSVFSDNKYTVFSLEESELLGAPVFEEPPAEQEFAGAGILPPLRSPSEGLVGGYLNDPYTGLPSPEDYPVSDYSAKLRLDYVAPPTVGFSVGGPFGSRVAGGVGFFFSDMLGNHNLGIIAQANGTIKDIGGQVAYLNRQNRINYGASAGHIPYLFGGTQFGIGTDPETGQRAEIYRQILQRIYIDQVAGNASYPVSTTRRFELSLGFTRYAFDWERETYYRTAFGVRRNREKLNAPDPFYFFGAGLAFIGDYSFFGFTSPVTGGRYRFQVAPQIGTATYVSVLADYRRYRFFKPLTFALRGLHIGNYGAPEEDNVGANDFSANNFTQQYLGYAYYPGFIRGYNFSSFEPDECTVTQANSCAEWDRLQGSRILLASAEVRLPLLGTQDFGLLNFPYLPTELTLFADGGLAWNSGDNPLELLKRTSFHNSAERMPVLSAGVSTRVNVLGYLVLEIFYAKPFQRPEKGWHFGFQLMPGW